MADDATRQGALFDDAPGDEQVVTVSARCDLRTRDGQRVVVVAGVPALHFAVGDRLAEAHAIVSMVGDRWATQVEAARAFGVTARTVRRMIGRFDEGGLAALGRHGGYPRGRPRLAASRVKLIERPKARGDSNCAIAVRLRVTEKAVRKVLRRRGWEEKLPEQGELALGNGSDPNLSASVDEPLPVSLDRDPADRTLDRIWAAMGLLDDVVPMFRTGRRVPGVGVLLAIPAILETAVLDCARQVYGSIGPAFFGLRTSVVSLVLFALLRINRSEGLKARSPEDLGRIPGLDRAPEVKTLRRKLQRLASAGKASAFGRALAVRRVERDGKAMGFLYTDGHVRVYHGKH